MSADPKRPGPRTWAVLAIILVAVLGWWLLKPATGESPSATPASATPAPATPSATPRLTQQPTPGQATPGQQNQSLDPVSGLPWVAAQDLPREAQRTLDLIDRGGPFPYDKDGSTFGNFEGSLPQQRRGYYKEYTVETPGSRDRGARRIVTGDNDRIHYWTDDHYETFQRIRR